MDDVLVQAEWDALWSWHNDEQHRCAGREEYSDAQWHKERQSIILPFTSFYERRQKEQQK